MISRLYIKNFRNITELEITPSDRINLIHGDNGQGKSSVLYAIEYLLTDNLNEKIIEYVRRGQDKFILEMDFVYESNSYNIKVEGAKTTKKVLTINNEDVYKNSEATKKLNVLLNANVLKYSSISEQGKTAQILFDLPSNRLKKLKEILGIEGITDICEEIKLEVRDLENSIELNNKEIEILENTTYTYLDKIELPDIIDIKFNLSALEKDKKIYEQNIIIYNKYLEEFKTYQENEKLIKDNSNKISDIDIKMEELKKEIKDFSLNEFNMIQADINKLNISYEKERSKIAQKDKLDSELVSKANDRDKKEKEIKELVIRRLSTPEFNGTELDSIQSTINKLNVDIKELTNQIELGEQGQCPTCHQPYVIDVSKYKENLETKKLLLSESKNMYVKIDDEIKKYNLAIVEKDKLVLKKEFLNKELSTILDSIVEIKKEIEDLNIDDYDYLSEIKDKKLRYNELSNIQDSNDKINKTLIDLDREMDVLMATISAISTVEPEKIIEPEEFNFNLYNDYIKEVNVYDTKVIEKERIDKYNDDLKENKNKNELRIKVLKSDNDSLYYRKEILKESAKVMSKDFSSYLIDKGAVYLKDKMNEFFQKAYNKYEITFSQDKNSIDFFYGENGVVSPVAVSSGFEKAIIAVAFRIALCSLNNLNLMIFDEVDSDASADRSLLFYETILESLDDVQFFVITHYEETKEFLMNRDDSKQFLISNGFLN